MHSSRMRTVRSSSRLSRGGLPQCRADTPRSRHPPGTRPDTPAGSRHPPEQTPPEQTPPPGTRPDPPCGQTDACKNITFATSLRTVKISVMLVSGEVKRAIVRTTDPLRSAGAMMQILAEQNKVQ